MSELFELTREECEALLKAGVAGRIAVLTPDGPHILPVNYSVVDGAIVIRTTPDSVLGQFGRNAACAFEVDQYDYPNGRGWSVLARGQSHAVEDPDEVERIRSVSQPWPWADGDRPLLIALVWHELSGRRLGRGWDPLAHLPVRRVRPGSTGPMAP
jgi:nitroimidazol reductase NimA-like FMN-containing flavoprotein (pyridoxamine 5'-phosphate oxidase superfamily)